MSKVFEGGLRALDLERRRRVMLLGLLAVTGCVSRPTKVERATPAAQDDALARPFLAPLELTENPEDDAIVRVVGDASCTGTLIGEDLVLTAHHCVTARDDGRLIERDLEPERLRVELGGDDLPWGDVGVRAVLTPACGYRQGEGDLAIVVLDRKLIGMPVFEPRLTSPPVENEEITPWGFGRCAGAGGTIRRSTRLSGRIDEITAGVFRATAAICPGDSGGPVLSAKREVVGVVSAAVMDNLAATRDTAYFARLDRFAGLFSAAHEVSEGRSPQELPPYRSCDRTGPASR